ncbi:MAG TPA: PIG-L deacetylase family protein [Victivallales bacterium]|nr:PIG-L deacetylase family protein [Victivallales bacterium]
MKKDKKNILIIAARPDDEVLGCGGTIAKEIDNRNNVKVVILATGKSSRYINKPSNIETEIDELYKESAKALNILGVHPNDIVFGNFPDQKLDSLPILDIIHFLKEIVQQYQPNIVYTHHVGDYNIDHRIVFDASVFVCRPYHGEHCPEELYSFEVLSSTEWAYQSKNPFKPNMFIDIKKQIDRKKQAILAYKSELKDYPHPRSEKGVENLAMKRGNEVSKEYSEAFELIRKIN